MLNVLLVALVRPDDVADSVYPFAAWLMLSPVKAATPKLALRVVVPVKVPPPGFAAIATVIEAVEVVTILPKLSWTETVGGPAIVLPEVEFPGCVEKATFVAAAGFTMKSALRARQNDSSLAGFTSGSHKRRPHLASILACDLDSPSDEVSSHSHSQKLRSRR